MSIYIIYDRFYDYDLKKTTLGGVQTYISSLSEIFSSHGWEVNIVQAANHRETIKKEDVFIHGLNISQLSRRKKIKEIFKFIHSRSKPKSTLIIWASFYDAINTHKYISISIQHGISFDYLSFETPIKKIAARLNLVRLLKYVQRNIALTSFEKSNYKVCVDYNFLNWYRTFRVSKKCENIKIIPNFTEINDSSGKPKKEFKRVIFARRFIELRGAYLAEKAADCLLQKHNDISFTFAGEGKLETIFLDLEKKYKGRVHVIEYNAGATLDVHLEHDISIIPTLGSEGTSLSLLEAMASGCAVICTNIGGMTNIVIDGFNGLIINPNLNELINAIDRLYGNIEEGQYLSLNAIKTVEQGFSKKKWAKRWISLLNNICEKEDIRLRDTVIEKK